MSIAGYSTPSTLADDSSVGSVAWSSPSNAGSDDGSYATALVSTFNTTSHYLKATNFGFSIPAGATINGISVRVERYKQTGATNLVDYSVRLVKGGTISGDDNASATIWPTSPTVAEYGGASDLWGLSWSYSDINASTFGVVIAAQKSGSGVAAIGAIDVVQIQIVYNSGGSDTITASDLVAGTPVLDSATIGGTAGGAFAINAGGDTLLANSSDKLLYRSGSPGISANDLTTGAPTLGVASVNGVSAVTITAAEASPPTWWIDVLSGSTKLGDGPITSATSWRFTPQLSRAGSFEFQMPASDPRAALLASKRVVTCYALQNGAVTSQGSGIIDRIEVDAGPPAMLRVSGGDRARELTYRIMEELRISGSSETTAVDMWFYDKNSDSVSFALDNAHDGDLNTTQAITFDYAGVDGDKLYIQFAAFPAAMQIELGSRRNGWKRVLLYEYWQGSGWAQLEVVDGTIKDGAPWGQSGLVSWTTPDDVVQGGWSGVTDYVIRVHMGDYSDNSTTYMGTVDVAEIYAVAESPSTADITQIMALAPSPWTLDTSSWYSSTVNGSLLEFTDETVLAALIKLADQTGEAFRIDGQEVEWLRTDTPDSGIRLFGPVGDPALVAAESDQAVIGTGGLKRIEDTYEEVTRVYPYGAGNGPARLTLEDASDSAPSGYTLSTSENYLERTGASPAIYRSVTFSDIRPVSNTGDAYEAASNRLLAAAHAWLEARTGYYAYELSSVYGLPASLKVGETVRVVYREVIDGYVAVDIDADLVVLSIERRVDARGVQVAGLTVASKNRHPMTDDDVLTDTIQRLEDYQAYAQELDQNYVK